ncbi:MAG: hypothetical protein Q8M76_04545, partial [Spirochaetaceae bacterium]|nr:hypothetical protein [Spirochaetaceae bacterium]
IPGEGVCPRCGAKAKRSGSGLVSGILGAACGLGAAIQAVVDLSANGSLTWSRISIASCAIAWALVGLPLAGRGKPRLVSATLASSVIAYLWFLERITAPGTWFLPIGLPIAASSMTAIGAVVYVSLRARRKGPNIAAFILVGAAAVCVSVDLILSLERGTGPLLGWSIIALASALPIAALLLDIQKRIRGSRTVERVTD